MCKLKDNYCSCKSETKWNSIKRIDELEQDVDDEMEANEFLGVKDSVEVKFNQ